MSVSIHPEATPGVVSLTIADLDRSVRYYRDGLGLHVRRRDDGAAWLGTDGADILHLVERPGALPHPARGVTGLYHFAILVPSRRALARSLRQLAQSGTPLGGASDHRVSEALYLTDPDGNGIEIYRDRPRDEWAFREGTIVITTERLDFDSLLGELAGDDTPWLGLEAGTRLGHMHLHVGHLPEAVRFYQELIGLDLMMMYGPTAAFLSAGGYHHHLGLNTWAGVGAPAPPEGMAGLNWWTLELPADAARQEVIGRLKGAGWPVAEHALGTLVRDPAGNGVVLTVNREQSTSNERLAW